MCCLVDLDYAGFKELLDFGGNFRVLQVTENERKEE